MVSGIRDNHNRGTVGQFLLENIKEKAELSILSRYFTVYAYKNLQDNLKGIKNLRFLLGEPAFIKPAHLNQELKNPREFKIVDDNTISLENRLSQKANSRECAEWLKEKVEIKSLVKPNFLHGNLYHIKNENEEEKALLGSSHFTTNGLGFGNSSKIELNMVVSNECDRIDLENWFDEIWNNKEGLVEDVK